MGLGRLDTFKDMTYLRAAWRWLSSSRGVVVMMSVIAGLSTLTLLFDERLHRIPGRPVLVMLSTLCFVIGFGVASMGRRPSTVGWVGLSWMIYAAMRGGAWMLGGNFTGLVASLPSLLLGLVVFARRRDNVEGGPGEGRSS